MSRQRWVLIGMVGIMLIVVFPPLQLAADGVATGQWYFSFLFADHSPLYCTPDVACSTIVAIEIVASELGTWLMILYIVYLNKAAPPGS
jgi:hypothetical protein